MGRDGMGWRREGGGRGGVGRGRREWYEDKGTVWRRVVFRVHMEREEGKGWNQRKEGTAPEGGRDGTGVVAQGLVPPTRLASLQEEVKRALASRMCERPGEGGGGGG